MQAIIKHRILSGLLIGGILVTTSCTYKQEREQLRAQANDLEQKLHERDSSFNSLMSVMTEVESQIEKIKEQENLISTIDGDFGMGSGDRMVADLENINSLISATNAMVRDLSKKLDQSNIELTAFRKKVKQIEKDLQEREASLSAIRQELAMKDQKIESLETEVGNLHTEVALRDSTIEIQKEELNNREITLHKAYFAVDTESKLREEGLITKEGGFLGLGKTTELQPDAVQGKFTEIDIQYTKKFFIDSEKAEVITEHPTNSYKLVKENDRIQYLEVTDPVAFWKISKFLVVSTKS